MKTWAFVLCVIGVLLGLCSSILSGPQESRNSYLERRKAFLAAETKQIVGAGIALNDKEKKLNEILMSAKEKEVNSGFSTTFAPTVNFLIGRYLVEQSAVFNIIKQMPKGGILHIHEISIADPKWVISNITYLPHLYYCVRTDFFSSLHFKFSENPPGTPPSDCRTGWISVAQSRTEMGAESFDALLYTNFTMSTPHPDEVYPNTTMSWLRFQGALTALTDLYFNTVSFKAMVKQGLGRLVQDNVQYIEIRTIMNGLQELNGTVHPPEYTFQQFKEAIEEFKGEFPSDFSGAKIIFTSIRVPENKTLILEQVKMAMKLLKEYPECFAGYDLVAQEDLGGPLVDYIDQLLYPSQQGVNLPFFFHAGETNWEGTSVDRNLIDAILLNTSRIGHGYAINKHPGVMEAVKTKGIAIELNPISNQVLHLVHDLRNHIGAGLIADNYPVVVSSDDPAAWGALPLSHDYYMAFMGLAGETTGLTLLKQLAMNTIKYSAMTTDEKAAATKLWQAKWDTFVGDALKQYGYP
ncbi:adenosine deaminase 2-like [Diadema antillarum]|uniref:adenosine deaminase 2-like n=1 Tax=Diadema antillarum TaxID=105358 RepID=UPI003A892651